MSAWLIYMADQGMCDLDSATVQKLVDAYMQSVIDYGVACCHHTCKNLAFNAQLIQMSSLTPAQKQKFAKPNDIIMAVTSENVEDVCKCVVWEGKELVAVSGHSIIISHNQNARYLAYYFTSSHFQSQKEKCCFGTKVIEIKLEHFSKILVPIPNIEEQNRIVEILDKFYTITNSLTEGIPAEIEARQKQYEYYRDKLLAFKELVIDK